MSDIILKGADYDHYLFLSEKIEREGVIASNEAFVRAMAKAVKRGREKAKVGTFVDDTPPPAGVKRLRGTIPISACGSPSALCLEAGSTLAIK